jgi:hypothetical protein
MWRNCVARCIYKQPSSLLKIKEESVCLTKHHAMKTHWGGGAVIAPHILDLRTRWRWVVSFTPWPLYPQGKISWYPFYRRLDEP